VTSPHRIYVVLLAAGGSTRMRGRDKLLESVDGKSLLRLVAERAAASNACGIMTVFGGNSDARRQSLDGLTFHSVVNEAWATGMASSIGAGIRALPSDADGAVILLGDMPEISPGLIDRLIAGFDPERGSDIVRPVAASGPVGNPVLFGRRHFSALESLTGDSGAKRIITANPDAVVDVQTDDDGVLIDLDTPEAWSKWRSSR